MNDSSRGSAFSSAGRAVRSPEPVFDYDPDQEGFVQVQSRQVTRYSVHTARKSGTEINQERLPPLDKRAGMELAYREQPLPQRLLMEFADRWLLGLMAVVVLIEILLGIGLPMIEPLLIPLLLPGSGAFGFFIAFGLIISRKFTLLRIVGALTIPPLSVLLLIVVTLILPWRLPTAALLSVITFVVLARHGKDMFRFYDEWQLTAPHLTTRTRHQNRLDDVIGPDLVTAALVLAIAVLFPYFSPLLAFAGVLGVLGLSFIMQWTLVGIGLPSLFDEFRRLLAQYLTYGRMTSGAPGIWLPSTTVNRRMFRLLLIVSVLTVTFTVALQAFFPWDIPFLFRAPFKELAATERLAETHGWLRVAAPAVLRGDLRFLWCLPIALTLAMVIPTLFLFVLFLRPLGQAHERRLAATREWDRDDRPEWQWYVDRLRSSAHVTADPLSQQPIDERGHLFLGVEPQADYPVLLDKRILSEHAYIVGESGSGKTSLGLMPLLIQLLRSDSPGPGTEPPPPPAQIGKVRVKLKCKKCGSALNAWGPEGPMTFTCPKCQSEVLVQLKSRTVPQQEPPPPIVILDLKGDPALFQTMRAEAEVRQPGSFRWFTPEPGKSSHYFNPFDDFTSDQRSIVQVCELFLESLGLSHGEGYGRSYFTRQSRLALLDALKSDPPPRSFEELNQIVAEMMRLRPNDYANIGELLSTLRVLGEYPQLSMFQPLEDPSQAIHMPSVLEQRQVVYFWLPAALESVSVREIGKLALYSLLSAAIARQREGKPVRQSYLVIDEFQRIAGENFKIILEQARSFGIGLILANQSLADLRVPSGDLRPTVLTNTRAKMYFSISDPFEMRNLQSTSGEELVEIQSWSEGEQSGLTIQGQNSLKPRLTVNDILSVSDHPLDYFFQVSRGSGYTQFGGLPIRVRTNYPISAKLYRERFDAIGWPEFEPYQLQGGAGVVGDEGPEEMERRREEYVRDFDDRLRDLYEDYDSRFRTPRDAENPSQNST
ncbi:MAG: type IV secretory system conjugative DNA transfer family protein [Planctomycetaceae bacterium]|nr:type IV secretory system conjugative DNA transfer family protein [Planctomycetaceae bacterium]